MGSREGLLEVSTHPLAGQAAGQTSHLLSLAPHASWQLSRHTGAPVLSAHEWPGEEGVPTLRLAGPACQSQQNLGVDVAVSPPSSGQGCLMSSSSCKLPVV